MVIHPEPNSRNARLEDRNDDVNMTVDPSHTHLKIAPENTLLIIPSILESSPVNSGRDERAPCQCDVLGLSVHGVIGW